MVMNRSKPTIHSDDELSRFIDLIRNAIYTPIPNRNYVWTYPISIPMEFTFQTNNYDEEVDDHTEEEQQHENRDKSRR